MPGGGIALINAASGLESLKLKGDEAAAIAVMRRALEAPLMRIARNAGLDGAVIAQEVRRLAKNRRNKNTGHNVLTGEYVDMIKSGIIDPLKVTRSAVENATSVACMALTTEGTGGRRADRGHRPRGRARTLDADRRDNSKGTPPFRRGSLTLRSVGGQGALRPMV